jgi:hypothetical protein
MRGERIVSPTARQSKPKAVAKARPTAKRSTQAATGAPAKQPRSSGDWRARTLARMRRLVHEADRAIVEERKWRKPSNPSGVPVWSHAGIVCTAETYKQVVKLTFARGAFLEDPGGLFNASLEGGTRRAIDIREGEAVDAQAFKALIRAAVVENLRVSDVRSGGRGRA